MRTGARGTAEGAFHEHGNRRADGRRPDAPSGAAARAAAAVGQLVHGARGEGPARLPRRVRGLHAGRVRPDRAHAQPRRDRRDVRRRHRRHRRAVDGDAVGVGDRRHPRRRAGRPDRPRAHADLLGRGLLALHVPVGHRVQLRDADGLPRLPGHRLRRRVGRRRRAGGRAGAAGVARQGARRDPERVGRRLGAGRRRLPDHVRAVRRDGGLARADVPGHPAGVPDPLHPPQRRGPRGLQEGGHEEGRAAAQADPPGQAAQDDDRGVAAGDRHPGRLLRDVHLDPDLPQDGARPDRGRHERLPVRGHRRARSSAT